jgi:endonuclease-8
MPEGDTIYRTAETLRRALGGKPVTRFETAVPGAAAVARRDRVEGRLVQAVESRGKHLLMVLRREEAEPPLGAPVPTATAVGLALHASDLVLHTHLGMDGAWHIYRPHERWRKAPHLAVVVVGVPDMVAACFAAPVVELLTAREVARHPLLASLGPDAITLDFDAAEARRRMLAEPDLEIGVALMNQRAMAGVGNVFKSEVLFLRRVSPFVRVAELPPEALDALIAESHRLLRLNRDGRMRRTRSALDPDARLWVYGRSRLPCRVCGTRIQMRRQGPDARSTYFCPRCQGVAPPLGR